MRQQQLREIIRDADVAHAIRPIVRKHDLTIAATAELLAKLAVPRARGVAEIAAQGR